MEICLKPCSFTVCGHRQRWLWKNEGGCSILQLETVWWLHAFNGKLFGPGVCWKSLIQYQLAPWEDVWVCAGADSEWKALQEYLPILCWNKNLPLFPLPFLLLLWGRKETVFFLWSLGDIHSSFWCLAVLVCCGNSPACCGKTKGNMPLLPWQLVMLVSVLKMSLDFYRRDLNAI